MKKLIILAAVIVCSLAAAAPASAGARYERQSITCLAKENPYTGSTLVAAKVSYFMINTPDPKNNMRKMSIEVRLVPPGPGLRWNRSWRKSETDKVSADGANRRLMTSTTNFEVAHADAWIIETRLTWRRRGKNDWEVKFEQPFNMTFCKQVA